jgi:hypothetical protein
MKGFLIVICLFVLCIGCNHQKNEAGKNTDKAIVLDTSVTPLLNLLGSYVGAFGTNKIALLITNVTGDAVTGRSIVGGNDRPFSGRLTQAGDVYHILANEPGDDTDDGTFDFSIDTKKPAEITGSWKPNKPTDKLAEKKYILQKRAFAYLQDAGDYPEASKQLLKESNVENLHKEELEMMRNEIFARHGYSFNKKYLREQFENKDWYIPNTVDVKNDLTDIEKKNIALIKRYEKYAEEYGDDFGR